MGSTPAARRMGDLDPVENRFHFAEKVGVGEHDAFWIGGSSGGVEQGSDVIAAEGAGWKFPGHHGKSPASFPAIALAECAVLCGPGP